VLTKLVALGVNPAPEAPADQGDQSLAERTFVLTGTLSAPRPDLKRAIEAAGGKVTGSVSAKTSYLLAGQGGGSKRKKAEKLGVRIIDEAAFERLLQGGEPPDTDQGDLCD
jgi:DNA ligase (NAD+)